MLVFVHEVPNDPTELEEAIEHWLRDESVTKVLHLQYQAYWDQSENRPFFSVVIIAQ